MKKCFCLTMSLLILTSCSPEISPDIYAINTVGTPTETHSGTIKSARAVLVKESDECTQSGAGILAGGALGGIAGNQIGKGHGNALATVGGALAGAAGGAYAEKRMKEQKGIEYVIALDNGDLMTIVQGPQSCLSPGDKVFIMIPPRGRARVVRQ